MGAADGLEDLIVVALDTQAHPVKTFSAQPPQQPGADGIGVGFKGDLRIRSHIKALADGGQNGGHAVTAKEGGGPPYREGKPLL